MPATSEAARERKREYYRKRWAELHGTPEARAAYNAGRRQGGPRPPPKPKVLPEALRPFAGCDGEGFTDSQGRHGLALFRMGERELYKRGRRLSTPELLRFIVEHPGDRHCLVGFAFSYDAWNILRDIVQKRDPQRRTLRTVLRQPGFDRRHWAPVRFKGWPAYGVRFRARGALEVCQLSGFHAKPGSIRRIFDVFAFFQCSFVKALEQWGIGTPEERQRIEQLKTLRSSFDRITREIRDYNKAECEQLAQLMEEFRRVCHGAGFRPDAWTGPGRIAAFLHKQHETPRKSWIKQSFPEPLLKMAWAAYYGGRFEVFRIGRLPAGHECDINSAYPAAMLELPCLLHGDWRKASASELRRHQGGLYLAPVHFSHPARCPLGGLPIRKKTGTLYFPSEGSGTYWSVELEAARRLGAHLDYGDGWRFEPGCSCRPFDWIKPLYEERLKLGKAVRGLAFRLALNSLYGKLAQRVGKPPFQNPFYAGLITAHTRAQLVDAAIAAGLGNVLMIATDAVYAAGERPALDYGTGLGQFDCKPFPALFIVKPGLYWIPGDALTGEQLTNRLKSRGTSRNVFEKHGGPEQGESIWRQYLAEPEAFDAARCLFDLPKIKIPVELFITGQYALHANKLDELCQWRTQTVEHSFYFGDKRGPGPIVGEAQRLDIWHGGPGVHSIPLDENREEITLSPEQLTRELFDGSPDYIELAPPFKGA